MLKLMWQKREELEARAGQQARIEQQARSEKDWTRADAIRDRLAELGVALEDGPVGTRWRMVG